MAFRNVLVHIDDTKPCAARIEAAVALAAAHEARLTGLYVIGEATMPTSLLGLLPTAALEDYRRGLRDKAEETAGRFRKRVERAGLSVDCRIDEADKEELAAVVAVHARYCDLAILGQPDPDDPPPGGRGLPDHVILTCGRPVLMVPYIGAGATLGTRVMVAWDAGREAARAVNDALPMLERAKNVLVLLINPASTPTGHGEVPGADISLHLARHNVKVETRPLEASDIGIADLLLSQLADENVDLLVMGAYGHSRAREFVLGGVTREILRSMTVPVLMSH